MKGPAGSDPAGPFSAWKMRGFDRAITRAIMIPMRLVWREDALRCPRRDAAFGGPYPGYSLRNDRFGTALSDQSSGPCESRR